MLSPLPNLNIYFKEGRECAEIATAGVKHKDLLVFLRGGLMFLRSLDLGTTSFLPNSRRAEVVRGFRIYIKLGTIYRKKWNVLRAVVEGNVKHTAKQDQRCSPQWHRML